MADKSKNSKATESTSQSLSNSKSSDMFRYRHKGTINEVESQWLPLDNKYIDKEVGSQEQISQWIHKNRFYFPSESTSNSKREITDVDVHPLFHNRAKSKEPTETVCRSILRDTNVFEKNRDKGGSVVNSILKNTSDKNAKSKENHSKKDLKKGEKDARDVQKAVDKRKPTVKKVTEVKHKFLFKPSKRPINSRLILPPEKDVLSEIKIKTSSNAKLNNSPRRLKSKITDGKTEASKHLDESKTVPVGPPQRGFESNNDEESRPYELTTVDNLPVTSKVGFKRIEDEEKHDTSNETSENYLKVNKIWLDSDNRRLTNKHGTCEKCNETDKTETAIDVATKTTIATDELTRNSVRNIKTNRNINVNYCLLQPTYFTRTNNKKPRAQCNGVNPSIKFAKAISGGKRTQMRSKENVPDGNFVNNEITETKPSTDNSSVKENYSADTITNNYADSASVTDKNGEVIQDVNPTGSAKKFISKATIIRINRRQRKENGFNKFHNSRQTRSSEYRNEKRDYMIKLGLKDHKNVNKPNSEEREEANVAEKQTLTSNNDNEIHHFKITNAEKKMRSNTEKCTPPIKSDFEMSRAKKIVSSNIEKNCLPSKNISATQIEKALPVDKQIEINLNNDISESLKNSTKENGLYETNDTCGRVGNKKRKVSGKRILRKSMLSQNYWQHKKEKHSKALKQRSDSLTEVDKVSVKCERNCCKIKTTSDSKSENKDQLNDQLDMMQSKNSAEGNCNGTNIRGRDSKRGKSITKRKNILKHDEGNNDDKLSLEQDNTKTEENNAISINLPVGKKYNINAPNLFSVLIDDKNPLGDSTYGSRRPKLETLYQNSTEGRQELRNCSQTSSDKLYRATARAPKKFKRAYRDQQIQLYNKYLKSTIKEDVTNETSETDAIQVAEHGPVRDKPLEKRLQNNKSNSDNFPFINRFGSNDFINANLIDFVGVFDKDGDVLTNTSMKHQKEPKTRQGLEGIGLDLYRKDKASWMKLMDDDNKSEAFYTGPRENKNRKSLKVEKIYGNTLKVDSKPEQAGKDEEMHESKCRPQKVSGKKKKSLLQPNAAKTKPKTGLKDHHVQFVDKLTDASQVFSSSDKSCFSNKETYPPKNKRKSKSAAKEILFCTNNKNLISNLDLNEDRGNRSKTVLVYSRLSYKPSHEDTSYKSLRYHELKVSDISHADISKTNRKKKFIKLLKKMFTF